MALDRREGHPQTWVKVNAPVDEGIAELVSALNEIEGVQTIESCQGEPGGADAYVFFRFGTWADCGALMFDSVLPLLDADGRACVSLSLVAYDETTAMEKISADPAAVPALVECVCQVSATGRKCGYSDGRLRTSPDSSPSRRRPQKTPQSCGEHANRL